MLKINSTVKITLITFIILGITILTGIISHLILLPYFVQSEYVNNLAKNTLKQYLNLDFEMKNPKLTTRLNPNIDFSVDNLLLKKDEAILVQLDDFSISVNCKNILNKKIKLNYLKADNLTLFMDKLINSLPKLEQSNKTKPFDWKLDLYNSSLALNKFNLSYTLNKANILAETNNIKISQNDDFKTLDFNSTINVSKQGKNYIKIAINAINAVKLMPDKFETNNLEINLNNSKLKVTSKLDANELLLNAKSNTFYLEDVFKIISSDVIIPDGQTLLAPLINPKGQIGYDVTVKNNFISGGNQNDLSGTIFLNNTKAQLKDLSNIPLNIQQGKLIITKDKVEFVDLLGYYGKNKRNSLKIYGDIKDYYKSMDSNINVDTKITNEFFKDYLAKLINNTVIYTSKPIATKIIYKSKFNIMDIVWLAKIDKGVNFGSTETVSALSNFDRAIKGDFHIEGNKLNIKNINYYIASDIHKGVKIKPILTLDGEMDLSGNIDRIGFFFAREMPCEFLNIFTKEKLFRKGTIKGSLHVAFKNKIPYLITDMEIKNTFIPSQRLRIKQATLKSNVNDILINTKGSFKRAKFEFKGKIKNALQPPFVIRNLSLAIDEIDVDRILKSLNAQQNNTSNIIPIDDIDEDNLDDDFIFDTNLIRIVDGEFKLNKGKYKELEFGNIDSDITLDEKGILKIQSNKFDIAKGISTLKVVCDLTKLKYYVRLGVKDVDSDLMARVLLNLDKEISGKASGLVELNSDKSMKMNGTIKFLVLDGTIGKIGLVEYVLKIASVFRNPVVMVSPQTIMDIINIPEGKFKKITGEMKIKDNVVYGINIKSYSSQLSALIRGRFDMDKHDASLRIYTRFSSDKKSAFGFLRNISLNAIANKVQLNTRNDANYYSSELKDLPQIEADEDKSQIFLTQVEGDVEHNNFLSILKKIK